MSPGEVLISYMRNAAEIARLNSENQKLADAMAQGLEKLGEEARQLREAQKAAPPVEAPVAAA